MYSRLLLLEMIKEEDYNDLRGKLEKITNQLNSLHNRLTQGRRLQIC